LGGKPALAIQFSKALVAASAIVMLRRPHLAGAIGSLCFIEHLSPNQIEDCAVRYSRDYIKGLTMPELQALLTAVALICPGKALPDLR
jgi:hypothetical protein